MPVYNHADYVIEMLQSIQNNTFQNWEVIAVDDGSDNSNFEKISCYCKNDSRINYFKRENKHPKGAQTCRNIGLEKAKGEYICFFDSDDFIAPYGLEQRLNEISKRPDLDFMVFRSASYKNSEFNTTPSFNIYGYPLYKDDIAAFCERRLPFIVWNNIYRRSSLISKNIIWDVKLKSLQDAQFNMLCILSGLKYEYSTSKPDYAYRHGVAGSISKKINTPEHLESNLYTLNYFYELVQNSYGNKYNCNLYKGTAHIYLTILRNGAPKWFSDKLINNTCKHSPWWGRLLAVQIYCVQLLQKILPLKVARAIPFFINLLIWRKFQLTWKPQSISKLIMACGLFLLCLTSCAQKISERDNLYQLEWSDEFNKSELDTTRWSKMKRVKGVRSYMHFTHDERFYEFRSGELRLYARHNNNYIPKDTAEYLTAGITTQKKSSFHYGKIEVRAKVKGAQGTWPAIWTLPEERSYHTTKSKIYAELDIMEYVDKNDFVYQTAHNGYTLKDRKNWYNPPHQIRSKIKFEKYNIYSVEILPNEIIFGVNGKETLRYPRLENEEHQFYYGIKSFLMLHMQVNPPKSWSKGVDPTTFPAYMDIDWVRVYKLKD